MWTPEAPPHLVPQPVRLWRSPAPTFLVLNYSSNQDVLQLLWSKLINFTSFFVRLCVELERADVSLGAASKDYQVLCSLNGSFVASTDLI